jgi:hypothetical protein
MLMLHRYQFPVDNNGTGYRDCDQASKSDRAIFKTLLSDSSPENLLPVPSKHKTNTFGGGCGPINGSILGLRRFQRLCGIPMMGAWAEKPTEIGVLLYNLYIVMGLGEQVHATKQVLDKQARGQHGGW